jgi:hypothetical protein
LEVDADFSDDDKDVVVDIEFRTRWSGLGCDGAGERGIVRLRVEDRAEAEAAD